MSQPDVYKATGVSVRTITRIENGKIDDGPSIEILEQYFALPDTSVVTDPEPHHTGPSTGLEDYTLGQLLAEAVRRVADYEARTGEHFIGRPTPARWASKDAPSAQRPDPPSRSRDVQ